MHTPFRTVLRTALPAHLNSASSREEESKQSIIVVTLALRTNSSSLQRRGQLIRLGNRKIADGVVQQYFRFFLHDRCGIVRSTFFAVEKAGDFFE